MKILQIIKRSCDMKLKKTLAFWKKTWVIFLNLQTDRCVYVDKHVEKWEFHIKNDMESIKTESKMWITFQQEKKWNRTSQYPVDKYYVNTRGSYRSNYRNNYKKKKYFYIIATTSRNGEIILKECP